MTRNLVMPFPRNNALLVGVRPSRPPTAAFVPTDIANLALWVKADAGLFQDAAKTIPAVADADPVGAWADQSGSGNDLLQATAGARPLLKLNRQNSKPGLLHDGTDDVLATAGTFAAAARTFFAVLKRHAGINRYAPGGASIFGSFYVDATPNWGWNLNQASSFVSMGAAGITAVSLAIRFNSLASADPYFNGVAGANFDPNDGYTAKVVSTTVGTGTEDLNSDMYEILLYTAALTDGQMAQVHTYLNGRWGVY